MPREKRKASGQAFERDAPPMPRVGQESGPGDQFHTQEELTRHRGGDDVEIPAAHGSGDPDGIKGGWKHVRRSGKLEWPRFADVSYPQGTKRAGLESTGSGMEPDDRRQKIAAGTASTTRNDADFDIQVADANMSSSDDPSSGLSSIASV